MVISLLMLQDWLSHRHECGYHWLTTVEWRDPDGIKRPHRLDNYCRLNKTHVGPHADWLGREP